MVRRTPEFVRDNNNNTVRGFPTRDKNTLFLILDTIHDFFEGDRGGSIANYIIQTYRLGGNPSFFSLFNAFKRIYDHENLNNFNNNPKSLNNYIPIEGRNYIGSNNTTNKLTTSVMGLDKFYSVSFINRQQGYIFSLPRNYRTKNISDLKIWFFYYQLLRSYVKQKTSQLRPNRNSSTPFIMNSNNPTNILLKEFTYPQILQLFRNSKKYFAIDMGSAPEKAFVNQNASDGISIITPAQVIDSSNLVQPLKFQTYGRKNYANFLLVIKRIEMKQKTFNEIVYNVYRQGSISFFGNTYTLTVFVNTNIKPVNIANSDIAYSVDKKTMLDNFIFFLKNDFMSLVITSVNFPDERQLGLGRGARKFSFLNDNRVLKLSSYPGPSVEELSSLFTNRIRYFSNNFNKSKVRPQTIKSNTNKLLKWCLDIKRLGDGFQHEFLSGITYKDPDYKYLSHCFILTNDYLSVANGLNKHGRIISSIVGGVTGSSYRVFIDQAQVIRQADAVMNTQMSQADDDVMNTATTRINPRTSINANAQTNQRTFINANAQTNQRTSINSNAQTNQRTSINANAQTNPVVILSSSNNTPVTTPNRQINQGQINRAEPSGARRTLAFGNENLPNPNPNPTHKRSRSQITPLKTGVTPNSKVQSTSSNLESILKGYLESYMNQLKSKNFRKNNLIGMLTNLKWNREIFNKFSKNDLQTVVRELTGKSSNNPEQDILIYILETTTRLTQQNRNELTRILKGKGRIY